MPEYEVRQTFVRVGKRSPGVLYEPAGLDDRTLTTVLVMHSDEDYLSCPTGPELARRGLRVLCANPMVKEGLFFSQIEKMQSVKAAIEFLRARPNVSKIVLMGHSGGGTLMTAYQAIAENGAGIFKGPEMIYPYPDDGALPPADGIMLLDSNWGNAAMQLFSLDPAVTDEANGVMLDSEYNLFEPANGFNPEGSTFSEEFIERFQKRQGERNNTILHYALSRLDAIEKGNGDYADDEPLIHPRRESGLLQQQALRAGYPPDELHGEAASAAARRRHAHDGDHPLLPPAGEQPVADASARRRSADDDGAQLSVLLRRADAGGLQL